MRKALIWFCLCSVLAFPILLAATSPLLAWRSAVYIMAGFAGIVAMACLVLQPLLAAGMLPGLAGPRGRRVHRWIGGGLLAAVVVHVGGLWITSPPDMIDALLFASPTPFSAWGVIAMWAVFAAAIVAALRRRLPRDWWRRLHAGLAAVVVVGSVVHAVLIEGTMETVSKWMLCGVALAVTAKALHNLRIFRSRR